MAGLPPAPALPHEGEGGEGHAGAAARIGPNAVLQLAAALRSAGGDSLAGAVFAAAGLDAMLAQPPEAMVDEGLVARLHRALATELPEAEARRIARDAGERTAAYILAHRIPRAARALLRLLPPGPSGRLLISAIGRNAWTFAGSGRFSARHGRPLVVEIAANPIAIPGCPWHEGVFEGLFRALVSRRASVSETACCARGASACRFEIAF